MDERNKDLPLIVSEILIEMHEMKEALNRVASVVVKQQEHMNSMFNVLLDENKKNVSFMASIMADARQENISLINEVRREGEEGRQFMTYSINKALGQQQQINAAFEQRLAVLEAKYNG
ncbi:hypothetical protein K3G63_18355 [Hymenobacter sp. HSC-4F20]|uniref:hypothetical protein n=1 Tax=Hymenobacter sp. HSC-4F20 TaxID=2864135 RepID=UPI001C72C98A|nr:hypothetical protein [Hymenobacter sp. HSC-4F20]MBX0292416.1 hypothetical protein [Hymenobacter sp. HSC-4F20]